MPRINDALSPGNVSNISEVQQPSPPLADIKKALEIMGGLAAAGFFGGLAWAFAKELYFDRSVRRPVDVERMLHLPLFLSIPNLSSKELSQGTATPALPQPAESAKSTGTELSPWSNEPALYPFHETLRDRLIGYFENKGLTHKPKLVAVTGIGHNGGVTTTAAGLASSLSETGDGNVLLVDMTTSQGSAQQFYGGKAVCGLEEILDTRDSAQIEGNLYVVGQEPGGEKLSRILPHRFNKLVPKLKASNFDYIIFDMPPVSQISITPRLAGFMDMVLLVIESEKPTVTSSNGPPRCWPSRKPMWVRCSTRRKPTSHCACTRNPWATASADSAGREFHAIPGGDDTGFSPAIKHPPGQFLRSGKSVALQHPVIQGHTYRNQTSTLLRYPPSPRNHRTPLSDSSLAANHSSFRRFPAPILLGQHRILFSC